MELLRRRKKEIRPSERHSLSLCGGLSDLGERSFAAMGELQGLLGRVIELRHVSQASTFTAGQIHSIYPAIASLNRELTAWYQDLPPELQWTSGNKDLPPANFFLLQ